jgi:hypothetical protein
MRFVALLIASFLLLSACVLGQPVPAQYSTSASGGAPTPTAPTSPESMGIQAPAPTESEQAPPLQESTQQLLMADESAAYSAPVETRATATSPSYAKLVVPPGGYVPNSLYVPYAPQTVASSNLYANLPLWMDISSSGPVWFYEWYPSGYLDVTYLGYTYPGWFKRWFFGDVPGWHILQYYCNGWSNYAYIYVYGPGGYWVSPYPETGSQPVPPSSGYSTVILRSDWFKGYNVYLDSSYIGTEGSGGDPLDGRYTFRVPGNRWHTIVITKGGQSYDETGTFLSGYTYRFTL